MPFFLGALFALDPADALPCVFLCSNGRRIAGRGGAGRPPPVAAAHFFFRVAGSAACAPDFLRGRYKKSSYPRRSTSSPDPADKGGPPVLSDRRQAKALQRLRRVPGVPDQRRKAGKGRGPVSGL